MNDRGTVRNMQFCSKNKSEKLVHLVGFIIRIYHDARSPERQKRYLFSERYEVNICTYINGINSSLQCDCDMSQGVSRRPLTADARIRLQDSPSEICGGQSGNSIGVCVSGFALSVPFHQCYLIISICMFFLPEGQTGEV